MVGIRFKTLKKHGLNAILFFIVLLSSCISGQMAVDNGDYWNAIFMTIEYSFLRTFFFIARSMVVVEHIIVFTYYSYLVHIRMVSRQTLQFFILVDEYSMWNCQFCR